MRFAVWTSAFLGLFTLAGCGGSGTGTEAPPPLVEAPDRTPPTVNFVNPPTTLVAGTSFDFVVEATDNRDPQPQVAVLCNAGQLADLTLTAPIVTDPLDMLCTATTTDASGNEASATQEITVEPDPALNQISVLPESLPIIAGKTILLQSDQIIEDAVLSGDLAGEAVTLERVGSNRLYALLVPDTDSDAAILDIQTADRPYAIELTIEEAPFVQDPRFIADRILDLVADQIIVLRNQGDSTSADELERLLAELEAEGGLNALTADELRDAAELFVINGLIGTDGQFVFSAFAARTKDHLPSVSNAEQCSALVDASRPIIAQASINVADGVTAVVAGAVALAVPEPTGATKLIAAGSYGIAIGKLAAAYSDYTELIDRLFDDCVDGRDLVAELKEAIGLSARASKFIVRTSNSEIPSFDFIDGEPETFALRQRTVPNAEAFALLSPLLRTVSDGLTDLLALIPDILIPSSLSNPPPPPSAAPEPTTKTIDASGVTLNFSDDVLDGTLISGEGSFSLTFERPNDREDPYTRTVFVEILVPADETEDRPITPILFDAVVSSGVPVVQSFTDRLGQGDTLEGMLEGEFVETFEIVEQPEFGSVQLTDPEAGLFTYTYPRSTAPFALPLDDIFSYQASNEAGASNVATVKITVGNAIRRRIDPRGTFYPVGPNTNPGDFASSPTFVDLGDFDPGTLLKLEVEGSYAFCDTCPESQQELNGVFVDLSAGFLASQAACPAPVAATSPSGEQYGSVSEAFVISSGAGCTTAAVIKPAGAVGLFVSVPDHFYSDNEDRDGDFTIFVYE